MIIVKVKHEEELMIIKKLGHRMIFIVQNMVNH